MVVLAEMEPPDARPLRTPAAMTRRLPHLADGTIVLRPWKVDDALALMTACREPDISYWRGLPSPYTFGHAVAWIGEAGAAWSDGRDAHLAVDDAATGEVVGAIDLLGVDPIESYGRFHYWVRAARRRNGVARRALSLLARLGPRRPWSGAPRSHRRRG